MKKKKKKPVVFILLFLILIGVVIYFLLFSPKKEEIKDKINDIIEEKPKPTLKIVDESSDSRPIAVMINNHNQARPYHSGLQDAYVVYEAIVEGGITRMMAVFKDQTTARIGSVRSSRHYFLDYVMENDAIYAHYGWSPQAESDIKKYSINNLNGITESTSTFWRVKDKSAPHNAVTSTEALLKAAKSKGYKTTSDKKSILNYVTDEVNLEDGITANSVTIPHSTLQKVKYVYDETNQVYKRYARNKAQTDWDTGNAITTKNIIITFCDNYTLTDSENKGRQGLKNIGTFDGYYITNGKAIKIKCTKTARDQQTKYEDLNGNEIKVNDGNTWVNICPTDAQVEME